MRIATFNVENLFSRARVMDLGEWKDGEEVLTAYSQLNAILQNTVYSSTDKATIITLLQKLDLEASDESTFVILRRNRGALIKRGDTGLEVVADGRGDWIGWLELKKHAVNEIATRMTAKVIQEVNADILAVVEAEDRIALTRFNEQLLKPIAASYNCIMLIDGNDERGIDVGILTKSNVTIEKMVSHVDDSTGSSRVFSRDCPEFTLRVGDNTTILVLVNHFKSKGFGSQTSSNARRKAQATRVREIYEQRRAEGVQFIAVVGDLNDTPARDPLSPLLGNGSDLTDVFDHPKFHGDGRLGTFGNGNASQKLDYLLLSPALSDLVTAAGVFRKGVWGGQNGTLFPHFPEMTRDIHAASDHAALWADITFP